MSEIMCTLTPRQIEDEKALVKKMYEAGMRSVRINTAHMSDTAQLGRLCAELKALLPDVCILIDTKGPEMRTTAIADDGVIDLHEGTKISVAGTASDDTTSSETIYINYPGIHREVVAGDRLLIDDGKIVLQVEDVVSKKRLRRHREGHLVPECPGHVDFNEIHTRVVKGGVLGSRKGIAVYGKDMDLPAVSERDREYIAYAATSKLIDEVAHSFVRSAADVVAVREVMGDARKPIIAKIENQQGIDNISGILDAADAVLIARGDLTASIGREAMPQAQQYIAEVVKKSGKPLYLATNILPSMMDATVPSQTDIDGIATAIRQGVDVMLLTNETAAGHHPLESVKTLAELCR